MGGGSADNIVVVNILDSGALDFDLIALGKCHPGEMGELEDYLIVD